MADCYKTSLNGLLVFVFILLISLSAAAQDGHINDTTYYVDFPQTITARLYTSQKYTQFTLKNKDTRDVHYYPNTTFNLGVGATYHNFSLNLAYGFGFLNPDVGKGKTKYLDLQSHLYSPKWVTDFEGQLYKGFYLEDNLGAGPGKYYYRGDVKVDLFGLSRYRIFNSSRFSYRAAFIQNEWQKKSAGTFLAGAEIYYGVARSDSSFIPKAYQQNNSQSNLQKINYFSFGPGIGYAYTLVLAQHVFFTGSVTGNLSFSFANEHLSNTKGFHFSLIPVTRYRMAAGYNGRSWDVSANWIADNLPFTGVNKNDIYIFNTGNYRFIIAHRFNTRKRLQKHLLLINKILKE